MRHIDGRSGLTLIELVVCTVMIGILAATALPVSKNVVRHQKEELLRDHLRTLREGIDRYYFRKQAQDGKLPPDACYPKTLEDLVEERILRRIPRDPMTGRQDWLTRSSTDAVGALPTDPTDKNNVFDVRSAALDKALDGTFYQSW